MSIKELLLKAAAPTQPTYAMKGRLVLSKSGWLLLEVPNAVMRGIFTTIDEPGVELPSYEGRISAHISVMDPEDLSKIGGSNKITERGQLFSYTLGPIKTVVPKIPGISRVWMVAVKSPDLTKLRRSYGLTSLPHDNEYQFHITVAQRKVNVLGNNTVAKSTVKLRDDHSQFDKLDEAEFVGSQSLKVAEFFRNGIRYENAAAGKTDGVPLSGHGDQRHRTGIGKVATGESSAVSDSKTGAVGTGTVAIQAASGYADEAEVAVKAAETELLGADNVHGGSDTTCLDHLFLGALDKLAAVGLPDRKYYGNPTKIPSGSMQDMVIQRHLARKAGCFGAATPVLMADGTEVAICELYVGQLVATPDGPKTVKHVWDNGFAEQWLELTIGEYSITVTPNHHFYVCDVGWVPVEWLMEYTCYVEKSRGIRLVHEDVLHLQEKVQDAVNNTCNMQRGVYAGERVKNTPRYTCYHTEICASSPMRDLQLGIPDYQSPDEDLWAAVSSQIISSQQWQTSVTHVNRRGSSRSTSQIGVSSKSQSCKTQTRCVSRVGRQGTVGQTLHAPRINVARDRRQVGRVASSCRCCFDTIRYREKNKTSSTRNTKNNRRTKLSLERWRIQRSRCRVGRRWLPTSQTTEGIIGRERVSLRMVRRHGQASRNASSYSLQIPTNQRGYHAALYNLPHKSGSTILNNGRRIVRIRRLSGLRQRRFDLEVTDSHCYFVAGCLVHNSHYDFRFGDPKGLYSWAMRHQLPGPGQKRLAVQQPMHKYDYKDFEGIIPPGYGAGKVFKEEEGQLLFTKVSPEMIHFTTAHRKHPERFVMFKPKGWGAKDWMIMNVTPTEAVPYEKVRYKQVPAEQVEQLIQKMQHGETIEAKVDGASSLVKILKDGVEMVSYRASATTGRPIVHTERFFHGRPERTIPSELVGTVLKGELYGRRRDGTTDQADVAGRVEVPAGGGAAASKGIVDLIQGGATGGGGPGTAGPVDTGVGSQTGDARRSTSVIPPQELGGILNATVANAIRAQREKGIDLKNMVYDIQQLGEESVAGRPRADRRQMIEKVLDTIDPDRERMHISEAATTPEEARKLWESVQTGTHPLTQEGIIYHPNEGKPSKAKMMEDIDVHVTGSFPGEGKYKDVGAGGLTYALEAGGPTVGRVGTGFSDELRRELHRDPAAAVGRVARIRSQQQWPSGAYRSPAFQAYHEDLPQSKVAADITTEEFFNSKPNKEGRKCPGCGALFKECEPLPDVEMCETCERFGPSKEKQALARGDASAFFEYMVCHNREDRDSGEVMSISEKERKRLEREWQSLSSEIKLRYHRQAKQASDKKRKPTVAVDMDGTLAKHFDKYDPNFIPDPRPNAKKVMQDWKDKGYRLIIFTVRGDKKLVKAWLEKHDIPFDYINENPDQPPDSSDKILADVYVDDRAVDGARSWKVIADTAGKRLEKVGVSLKQIIAKAVRKVRKPVSEAQADAGNYRHGHFAWRGLQIAIETKAGEKRNPDWPALRWSYGYINRTEAKDGDQVDVIIGPQPDVELVYVVDQVDPKTKRYDEAKVVIGAPSLVEARQIYRDNYEKGWQGLGNITPLTVQQFKEWLKTGDQTKPIAKQVVQIKAACVLICDQGSGISLIAPR